MATTTALVVAAGAPLQYDSQSFANSGVVKASSGILLGAIGFNKGASTLYLMWFNATSVPGNGAVPLFLPVPILAGATCSIDETQLMGAGELGPFAFPLTTGLCWAASTTPATLTVDVSGSVWVTANYV